MGNAQSAAAARAAERQLATGTDQKQPVCESPFNDGVYTRARLRRRLYRGYKYALADGMFWKYRGRYPFLATSRPGQLPGCDDVAHTCSHTNSVHDPLCKAFVRDFARKCRADARYHPDCPPRLAVGGGQTVGERLFPASRFLGPGYYSGFVEPEFRRSRRRTSLGYSPLGYSPAYSQAMTRCGGVTRAGCVTSRSAWES